MGQSGRSLRRAYYPNVMRKNMNERMRKWIDTRDKPGLLIAMMREFSGNSHISFEGSLENLNLSGIHGASVEETEVLKRQTTSPKLDFLAVPLNEATLDEIWNELSKKDHLVHEGIIHVQIENGGELVFGGYDNFHRECVVAYPAVPVKLLEELKENGVIRDFK